MKKKLLVVAALFLLMFQSCNTNDDLGQDHNTKISKTEVNSKLNADRLAFDSQSLSGFIANQLAIQSEIKSLLDNESNVNYSAIQMGIQNVDTIEELELLYKNANVTHVEELVSLYQEINSNAEVFVKNNPDFYANHNEEERLRLLTLEIDSQLSYSEESGTIARPNCHTIFIKATNRCMRNFAIEVVGSVAVGVFTGGVGGVIAGGIATAHMVACNADAEYDYHDCVHDGGQP